MDLKTLLFLKAASGEESNPNLLNVLNYTKLFGIPTEALSNGVIDDPSIASGNSDHIKWGTEFPAGTYTLSCKISGAGLSGTRLLCSAEFSGGTYNAYYEAYWKDMTDGEITITTSEAFTIGMVLLTGTESSPGKVYDLQFELGDHATPYKPYKE